MKPEDGILPGGRLNPQDKRNMGMKQGGQSWAINIGNFQQIAHYEYAGMKASYFYTLSNGFGGAFCVVLFSNKILEEMRIVRFAGDTMKRGDKIDH